MKYIIPIVVLGGCLSLPVFLGDFFVAHDILFHLNWNRHFTEQFWNGDLYPRWLTSMNGGRGSPVFFFYGPVPYFISAFLKPLIGDDPFGWLQLGFSAALALTLSGLFVYLWLSKIADQRSAFIASIAYMVLPYHLIIDLYYRFSYAEFWSFAWIPFILYSTHEIVSRRNNGVLKFCIGYALLTMTHLPTTLIFSAIPPIYAVAISKKQYKIKNLILILGSILLGIGLSAIYLIPVLFTQDYVNFSFIEVEKWKYYNNFIIHDSKNFGEFKNYIFQVSLFSFLLACFCCFIVFKKTNEHKVKLKFWFTITIISFFLMISSSSIVWENIKLIQKIQFPWRFNILTLLSTTALLAIMLNTERESRKKIQIGHYVTSGFILALIIIELNIAFEKSNQIMAPDKVKVFENNLKFNLGAPEYLPKWVPEETINSLLSGDIEKSHFLSGNMFAEGSIKILKKEPRYLEIETSGSANSELTIGQFFYPGWTAIIKPGLTSLPVSYATDGLTEIRVPSGHHIIAISLNPTAEERAGQVISSVFIFLILVFYILKKLSQTKRGKELHAIVEFE